MHREGEQVFSHLLLILEYPVKQPGTEVSEKSLDKKGQRRHTDGACVVHTNMLGVGRYRAFAGRRVARRLFLLAGVPGFFVARVTSCPKTLASV